ncbi:MAG: HmuY family protein [Rhodothermales bacterium]
MPYPIHRPLALLLAAAILAGCDSAEPDPAGPLPVATLTDIAADPTTGRDPQTGAPIASGRYTLVSLRTGDIVLASSETDRADSASTAWDLGFQGTNIIVNGGASGPGQGAAVLQTALFDEVVQAPADTELRVDGLASCPTATGDPGPSFAICPGAGNGWYAYDPAANRITPIAGRTLVVRTADGRFAKVRILSYYQGNPPVDQITAQTPSRYYTLEYVFQEDGSRTLTSE